MGQGRGKGGGAADQAPPPSPSQSPKGARCTTIGGSNVEVGPENLNASNPSRAQRGEDCLSHCEAVAKKSTSQLHISSNQFANFPNYRIKLSLYLIKNTFALLLSILLLYLSKKLLIKIKFIFFTIRLFQLKKLCKICVIYFFMCKTEKLCTF